MTHEQRPIGTGFGAESTTNDVIRGIDLKGKHAIVTGGHSGLGRETTRALLRAGASVTVASRDPRRARLELEGLEDAEVSQLDLIDPRSVAAFAERYLDRGDPLEILINNAAPPAPKSLQTDPRGYELQFATSHLGHFQLTLALLPALRAARGARVVNVSSGAQRFGAIRWNDPNFTLGYDPGAAYGQSKKANVLFTVELDRRYAPDGVRAYAVHPGVVVGTKLNSAAGPEALRAMGLVDEAGAPIIDPRAGKKTPAQGAATIVFAATSPMLAGVGGVYLKDCDISALDDEPRRLTASYIPADIHSSSIDPGDASRLWELSERLLE
ncbi:MAG: SDR family NAD(P)-dependent oxidoreductase [Polyangiaceae bacterium]